jgi:hypothetical protein
MVVEVVKALMAILYLNNSIEGVGLPIKAREKY